MCFLLLGLVWSKFNFLEYELAQVCYTGSDPTYCEAWKQQMEDPEFTEGAVTQKITICTKENLNQCLKDIDSYPVFMYMSGSTTGEGNDFVDLGNMNKNHIIQFMNFGGYASESLDVQSLKSHVLSMARLGMQSQPGTVPSPEDLHKMSRHFVAPKAKAAQGLTVHIKDTTGSSKVDCLFTAPTVMTVELLSTVTVQAAVLTKATLSSSAGTYFLKASYVLGTPEELYMNAARLQPTSAAVYAGSEISPDTPTVSKVVFKQDGWELWYSGRDTSDITIPSTLVQKDGQFSILQIAAPKVNVQVSLELPAPVVNSKTLAAQPIAGGVNLSVQRQSEVPTSIYGGGLPDENPETPSMTVTFGEGWTEVPNLATAKFVFEGDVTFTNPPTGVEIGTGTVSDRPVGPGVADAPKRPIPNPTNPLALIIGITVAVIVVVVAVIVGVVLFLRCKKKKDQKSTSSGKEEQPAE